MAGGTIFLNYRRDDSEGYVGRLYDHLSRRFPERVFRDVTNLRPGEDFVDALQREGLNCKVLLAVIGRHWLTVTGSDGKRRLDDPDDLLRQEIARALQRNIRVIPVLVGGAGMPQEDELPPDLRPLWRRQALPITELDFEHDMERLIRAIEEALGECVQKKEPPLQKAEGFLAEARPAERAKPLRWILGSVLATIVTLAIIGVLVDQHKANPPNKETAHASDAQPTPTVSPEDEQKAFVKELSSNMAAIKSWQDRVRSLRTEPTANFLQAQSRARQLLSALDSYDQQLNNFEALLRRGEQNLITSDEDRRISSTYLQLCGVWKQQSAAVRYEAQLILQYDPNSSSSYNLQMEIQTIVGEINALDMRAAELLQSIQTK